MDTYDVIVIGAGQSGDPLASAFATAGKKTAMIESKYVGGTCINVGCTPTKTMVASARIAYLARRAAMYGVQAGTVSVDLAQVHGRKESIVQSFRTGSENRLARAGVDLIRGLASFTGPKSIAVQMPQNAEIRQLTADTIVINAGARPRVPALEGLKTVPYLDSTSIMELTHVPEHLLVLGGGYVALEFGQMFRRFGSRVTVIEQSGQLLGREDADVAEAVLAILKEDGLEVLLNTAALRAEKDSQNKICLVVKTPQGERLLEGSHLLVATGRVPNSDLLNLSAAGIETDEHGNIRTDEYLATSAAGVYAVGDIKGGPAFTHISYDDFRILKANLLEGRRASIRGRSVPYTVFIDPQLGRIGLSEREAAQSGRNFRVVKMPMNYVARALEVGEDRGFMKALIDLDTNQILGAAILGIEGGELMAMIQIAILGKLAYTDLRDAVFAHPTLAESLNNLFAS